ncbi:MAG: small-conductance mechanosensitive ion channel [Burkholderiales bacterium]|nr:small-conductance mechanosensitive ion channel [Burkholderiales bacterium]
MPVQVTEFSEAFMTSLAAAMALLFSVIPKIFGFLLIVAVGWFLATLAERGLSALLRRVRFNELAQRSGLSDFVAKMGMNTDSSGMIGLVVKWFIRLVSLAVAFDALGLPAVSEVLRDLLLWLPNVVVALVILVIGGLAARGLSNFVRGMASEAALTNAQFLARLASIVVWAFAIVVAIHQIGIATELVNALFIAIVGSVALGVGLAFGLGGRDTAAEIVRNWYTMAQEKSAEMKKAEIIASEDATVGRAGSWPTGGYPGPGTNPAITKHDIRGE